MTEEPPPLDPPPKPRRSRPPRTPTPPVTVWARIQAHKVLQWSLAYLGAALALAHGQELLAHAFHWPEIVARLLLGVLIVGFPVAIVLAWFHGHKGMKHISAGEMTALAVLLFAGGIILTVIARSTHTGAPAVEATQQRSPTAAGSAASPPNAPVIRDSTRVRLAVLPLENLSPDPANTFFADGLHEEILSALAQRAPSLQVISRTTMMLYRQHPKPLTEVAKELGATHVIEGSVRREAQQIRLTLQLIDARSDQHIWAQTYDRTLAHSLTLQSEVANQVASHLAIELKAGGSAVTPSSYNPEAYDLYLKALGARNALAAMNGAAPDGVVTTHSILDAFTRAIHQDPTLAPAYAERVFQHLFEINSGGDDERAVRLALEDLETAERLAPTDPKIIAARAWYRQLAEQDPEGALQTFAAAEAAGLTDPDVMFVKSFALIGLGRTDESIRFVQRLLTVDPRNRLLIGGLAFLQAHNRQPIEALRTAELGIRQLPETPELKKLRAQLIFDYSGDLNALNSLAPGDNSVATKFYQLRLGHQYAQLERVLARAPPLVLADGLQFDAGPWPIARLRGWTCLLLGHTSQARSNGRALLDIVAHQKDTKWNRGHLRILAAEGHVLAGEHAEAVVAGQEGLRLFQGSKSAGAPLALIEVSLRVAAVYAWSGAQDQAVELLENVAKSTPAPGPLRIARDPLYTVPLAQNARFQHLVSDLEAQARATRLD